MKRRRMEKEQEEVQLWVQSDKMPRPPPPAAPPHPPAGGGKREQLWVQTDKKVPSAAPRPSAGGRGGGGGGGAFTGPHCSEMIKNQREEKRTTPRWLFVSRDTEREITEREYTSLPQQSHEVSPETLMNVNATTTTSNLHRVSALCQLTFGTLSRHDSAVKF
ncbi:hypothetical protein L3Q82_005612 [Scortum barcoo]|uniref:Uncharacterized protein n=1 Tax=Scortum barcoo TaxID=214431 RepID=A0ACB8V9H8_9TELE|nr:hypothetical protein L3Q82_005612 [Scortum barcoo]